MSNTEAHDDEFDNANTPGYKPTEMRTIDDYNKLDANDESLARWKASLGITDGGSVQDTSKPKVTVQFLELESSSLPAGRTIKVDISNPEQFKILKEDPIQVKEGADYKVFITFSVNHGLVTGARYDQVVKCRGIKVDKTNAMIGSYPAQPEPRRVRVIEDEFPSGMLARATYTVKSRVTDYDGGIFAEWEWVFKIGKEW